MEFIVPEIQNTGDRLLKGGTRWYIWLRHYCTCWQVVDVIPDDVTGIFHWLNSSICTVTLGLSQPQKEMSARSISLGLNRSVCMADNLTTFVWRLSWYVGASPPLELSGPALSRPVEGLLYLYLFFRVLIFLYTRIKNTFLKYVGLLTVLYIGSP